MIQITAHMRILVAVEPVDFRKGIDSLAALCRQKLQSDPFSGTLFVFVNKFRQALRVMTYDGQRFWLCHKRLSKDREDFSGAAFRILFKTGHCKYLPHEPAEYLRFGRRKLQQN